RRPSGSPLHLRPSRPLLRLRRPRPSPCRVSWRRTIGQGVFGFREIVGEEFMTMFLSVFSSMVQRLVPR
uniref:Uncharacterized protein n=1 Tax=Aegilops tauschii subsp. strangulata TaxID=200361 RepID=A0A453CBW7_AEGTS